MPKRFTEEEKAHILARVSQIGAAAAAKEVGASYNSVLRWVKEGKAINAVRDTVKEVAAYPGEMVEKIRADIQVKEEEIETLEAALKELKSELKSLQKAKAKAEKEKELLEKAEEKKKLVDALLSSGKSVDEIMAFLNK